MDFIYLALVYLSMLFYIPLPFLWLARHYVYLNYNMQKLEFKLVFYLLALVFLGIIYLLLSPYVNNRHVLPEYAAPFGAIVLVVWAVLEGWSLFLLSTSLKSIPKLETKLVKTGPYAIIRHPIYFAHLLFNFGAYLVTGAVVPLMALVGWLVLIKPLMDMEDEELALRIGERFHNYKKQVPQIIPKLR